MSEPVTVAIPVRNGGALLREVLAAVRAQRARPSASSCSWRTRASTDGRPTLARVVRRDGAAASSASRTAATRNALMERASGDARGVPHPGRGAGGRASGSRGCSAASRGDDVALVYGPSRAAAGRAGRRSRASSTRWFASLAPTAAAAGPRPRRRAGPGARRRSSRARTAPSLRSAWRDVPFPDVPYAEDQALALDMLRAGFAKVFVPDAAVVHSHDYGPLAQFRRTFDEWRGAARGPRLRAAARAAANTLLTLQSQVRATAQPARAAARGAPELAARCATGRCAPPARRLGSRADRLPPRVRRAGARSSGARRFEPGSTDASASLTCDGPLGRSIPLECRPPPPGRGARRRRRRARGPARGCAPPATRRWPSTAPRRRSPRSARSRSTSCSPTASRHGLDAPAVCRVLRDDPRLGDAWLLAITPLGAGRRGRPALDVGADDYLHRPFTRAQLLARTRTGLRAVQQRADAALLRALLRQRARRDLPLRLARRPPARAHQRRDRADLRLPGGQLHRQHAPHDRRASSTPTTASAVMRGVAAARDDAERPFTLEYRIVRADGEVRWVLDRGQLVPGGPGRLWMDGAIFDVTERREVEQALRRREIEAARAAELRAVERAHRRGGRRRAAADRARPARRRAAATRHAGARRRGSPGAARRRAGVRRRVPRAPRRRELADASAELRELARGIHPAVLTERGLGAGGRGARRAARRCRSRSRRCRTSGCRRPSRRPRTSRVAEALTNVAKYAQATRGDRAARARRRTSSWSRSATTASAARRAADGSGPQRPGRTGVTAVGGELAVDEPAGRGHGASARRCPLGVDAAGAVRRGDRSPMARLARRALVLRAPRPAHDAGGPSA